MNFSFFVVLFFDEESRTKQVTKLPSRQNKLNRETNETAHPVKFSQPLQSAVIQHADSCIASNGKLNAANCNRLCCDPFRISLTVWRFDFGIEI